VHEHVRKRAEEWWDHLSVELFVKPEADAGVEPWASLAEAAPDEPIPMFQPDQIEVVVTGGETNPGVAVASGRRACTVPVDEWR